MRSDTEHSPDELAMLDALGKLPSIEPKDDIGARFHHRAATTPAPAHSPRRWWVLAIAAGLVLAIGVAWRVDRAREERKIDALSTQLAAALTNLSAATRYQAVTSAGNSGITDSRIVAALTTSLLSDSSANVRAASATALGRIATAPALRSAAEASLRAEASPFVQLALLTATTHLSADDRAAIVRALLARPDLDPVVRSEAEQRGQS